MAMAAINRKWEAKQLGDKYSSSPRNRTTNKLVLITGFGTYSQKPQTPLNEPVLDLCPHTSISTVSRDDLLHTLVYSHDDLVFRVLEYYKHNPTAQVMPPSSYFSHASCDIRPVDQCDVDYIFKH